jgi:hypothetical protein
VALPRPELRTIDRLVEEAGIPIIGSQITLFIQKKTSNYLEKICIGLLAFLQH